MCEAGLPPPAAFCSKADLEVCAGARGLWETQVLKKTSLVLRKNPSDLKDSLPRHCNCNFKCVWDISFYVLH